MNTTTDPVKAALALVAYYNYLITGNGPLLHSRSVFKPMDAFRDMEEGETRDQAAARILAAEVRRLREDRNCEKQLRKDAEHKLCAASDLLDEIRRGEVNPEDEAEKWLRAFDPIRLEK